MLLLGDERAHLGLGIEAWSDLDLLGVLGDALEDLVVRALLDEQARAGRAALAVVEEDRVRRAGDRRLHVSVAVDDVRRLAAELERDLLEVARGRLDDQLADLGRAGERDLVDVVVRGERRAGRLAVARDDVDARPPARRPRGTARRGAAPTAASARRASARPCSRTPARARASTPPSAAGSSTG